MEHPGPASVNQLSSNSLNATESRCGDKRKSTTSDTHDPLSLHTISSTITNPFSILLVQH